MGAYQTYGTGPESNANLAGAIPRSTGRGTSVTSLENNSKAKQVQTLQATSTTIGVTLTKGGVSRSFSVTAGSAALAAAALEAAIEADGIAGGWVDASTVTDTVTCTARYAGTEHAVTYGSLTAITSTEATAASDGAAVGFGLAVMHGASAGEGIRPTATAAVAQVSHLTPAAVNSVDYYAGARIGGVVYLASYLADGSATVQEIVEGLQPVIDALMPASSIAWTEDNTKLIATAEVAGTSFEPLVGSSSASATWTVAESVANAAAALTRPLAGFAVRSESVPATVDYAGGEGTPASEYPAGWDMAVAEAGELIVLTDDTVSRFDPVYVRVTATGNEKVGSVRNDTDSGDAILLAGARFMEAAAGTAASHAPVKIQFDLSTALS